MREISSPLDGFLSPLGRLRSSAAPSFDPASLFASGEEGAWYDPSDLTTMWTDTAATTQATAVLEGDTPTAANAVARIDDKSGNGNHATQTTAPSRPYLTVTAGGLYYLSFDGADDFMSSGVDANVFLPAAGYLVVGGANFASVGGSAQAYQRKAFCGDQSGYFGMWAHSLNGGEAGVYHWDTAVKTAQNPYIAGNNAVFTGRRDGSIGVSGEIYASVNSVSSTGTAAGGLPSLAGDFVIGEQFGVHFDGNLYGLIVRGASSTTDEITNTEAYLAARSGVTI